MSMLAVGVAVALAAGAPSADAAPVVTGARFFAYDPRDLRASLVETRRILHRPLTSCYQWVIAVEPEDRTLTVRELFELPAAAGQWGLSPEQDTLVTADQSRAVTELQDSLDDGIITHGWCVAEGDPTGPHRIRVYAGEQLLHEFRFEVVGETY